MFDGCKCNQCEHKADCPRLKHLIETGVLPAKVPDQAPAAGDTKSSYGTAATKDWEDFWYRDLDAPSHSER